MAITSKVTSEEIASLRSHTTMPVKKLAAEYIINMQTPVITDPIDFKCISKVPANITMSSAVKAGLIFLGTIGLYYLTKTGILSYFGRGAKNPNSKNVGSSEIMEVKNRENALSIKTNLKVASRANDPLVNQITQNYKIEDSTVKFEKVKVEEFEDLLKIKKEKNAGVRRSILIPTFKGSYNTPGEAQGVAVSGNYAYVATRDSAFVYNRNGGLWIVDISDPSNPTFKGSHSYDCSNAGAVALSGNYAYVAAFRSGLQIIDVSDPSNPTFEGSYYIHGHAYGVAIARNSAYVAAGSSGLKIIDISDPSNLIFRGSYDTACEAYGVAVFGYYAYVVDGCSLQIIDVSEIPTFEGSYNTPGWAEGVVVSGNYAYVADRNRGLQIIDITNPSNPTFKGSYDTPGSAFGVALSGNYVYVADHASGLQIIDVSNPANPTFKSSYDTPGSAWGVAVSGNYAYVADMDSGLQIIALDIVTDLDIAFIIIGSISGTICIFSFCCALIGGGIIALRRYRNKISRNENNTNAKEQKEKKELENYKPIRSSDDMQVVFDNKQIVNQKKPEFIEYDEKPGNSFGK